MTKQLAILLILLSAGASVQAQTVSGKLRFNQVKKLNIQMELKASVTQQAGGQAIDFTSDASARHSYKITNSSGDTTSLHHDIETITFNFDGMGQKRVFDSGNQKDMEGPFGSPVKEILGRKFDMTIDATGKALTVKPEKTDSIKADERLAIVFTMLRDITNVVYPPRKGEASFFKVLPGKEVIKGDTWIDSVTNENGKSNTTYTLSDITDSTLIIDFKGSSSTITKAMMMGMSTQTSMNSIHTGQITLDRQTGIMKEKTIITESSGSTEAMGGTVPVNSKTTITIHVKPE